jgi:coenzyme F420-reducing hydrogenase beta subunit
MESRSGGIFTALSDNILNCGGVVYGCVLTEEFIAIHIRAENVEERNRMRGSKYIQSDLKDTFKQVKEDLDMERRVLFSGTSCQVAGLRSFLGKEYESLICVDIVCHGVPSPKVWQQYVRWCEKKLHGKCVEVNFRNKKKFGWNAHVESLKIQKKSGKFVLIHSKIFKTLFYEHAVLRPSCYQCPFKSIRHPGDISIADYWGIDIAAPEFSDNKGVSLVFINNAKGETLLKHILDDISIRETRIEDSMQPVFVEPFHRPSNRDVFWEDFRKLDFGRFVRKYGGVGIKARIRKCLSNIKWKVINFAKKKQK